MTFKEVSDMVKSIGLPYAYYEFPDGTDQAPPFVCFFFPESDDFFADNQNYSLNRRLYIELYCSSKKEAMSTEAMIEASLIEKEMPFSKDNDYISGERLYVTVYTMEVCYEQ